MRARPGRLVLAWVLGSLTALGVMTVSGGWNQYKYLPVSGSAFERCDRAKPDEIADGWIVVPNQPDPCYLERPRLRPWQWPRRISSFVSPPPTTAPAPPKPTEPPRPAR